MSLVSSFFFCFVDVACARCWGLEEQLTVFAFFHPTEYAH